jgi:serine-type D-Ala-D-Ala carboxypeptidase/endopeptidase (penicillin-binding protein 4)
MRWYFSVLICILSFSTAGAQDIKTRVARAYDVFEKDPQLKNGIASLVVIDARTGQPVFSKHGDIGLAPASTQKIITSITAFEMLGSNFRYSTEFGISDQPGAQGPIYIKASGDPTLGSWRWKDHSESAVISRITRSYKAAGIRSFSQVMVDETGWESELVPDGWIWQDIGNYYGAGSEVLNWRENQYDLLLTSGKSIGDPVTVKGTRPFLYNYDFQSFVRSAAKGTGDQSYIYLPMGSTRATVRGTIPINEDQFVISGSMPSPRNQFIATLVDSFSAQSIQRTATGDKIFSEKIRIIHTETSPVLDSIVYWFMKRSINLYGEALVKTLAASKKEKPTTANGIKQLKDLWVEKGIERTALNMVDGSGLSPLNRITTSAQVRVLRYARSQPWFPAFSNSFPEFNGMKMKSGTISGVKGFSGYHSSKSGQEYIFSFVVNNYNGSASSLVQKMYKVLDELK